MSDFYEIKAKKYKYKYLKLKQELEGSAYGQPYTYTGFSQPQAQPYINTGFSQAQPYINTGFPQAQPYINTGFQQLQTQPQSKIVCDYDKMQKEAKLFPNLSNQIYENWIQNCNNDYINRQIKEKIKRQDFLPSVQEKAEKAEKAAAQEKAERIAKIQALRDKSEAEQKAQQQKDREKRDRYDRELVEKGITSSALKLIPNTDSDNKNISLLQALANQTVVERYENQKKMH